MNSISPNRGNRFESSIPSPNTQLNNNSKYFERFNSGQKDKILYESENPHNIIHNNKHRRNKIVKEFNDEGIPQF